MKRDGAGTEVRLCATRPRGEQAWSPRAEREQKRLLTCSQAQELLDRLAHRTELEIHDVARPVETTRTTYLDTDDLLFFASSHSALTRRVRIREYGAAESPGTAPSFARASFLELKESADGRRRKVRYRSERAGIERVLEMLRCGGEPDGGDTTLAEIFRALSGSALAPRVCTLYRRLSLAVAPGVRITLDENVRFYRPPADGEPAVGPQAKLVGAIPGVVVEVKGPGAVPDWLGAEFEGLEVLPDFSKFRLGCELVTRPQHPKTRPQTASLRESALAVPSALRRRVVGRPS